MKDPAAVPLFGRSDELSRIDDAIEESLRAEFRIVWLSGETGAGKSRLLVELARRADGRGFLTFRGRACAGATTHALLAGLIDPFLSVPRHVRRLATELPQNLRADLEDLLRKPRLERSSTARRRTARRRSALRTVSGQLAVLLRLLTWLAERRPVALVIDDLQEASDEICTGLRHLLVRAHRSPLVLAVALRSDETSPAKSAFAAELEAQHDLARVDVSPLPAECMETLAGELFDPALGREIGRWLSNASQGNPLFAVEILRLLSEQGTIQRSPLAEGGAWELRRALPETVVPPLLVNLIADRFSRLGGDARSLAAALAIDGGEVPAARLARVAGLDGARLDRALGVLVARHWVAAVAGRAREPVAFAHPLAGRVTYGALPPPDRQALHARWAKLPPPRDSSREASEAGFVRHAARSGEASLRRAALGPAMRAAKAAAAGGEMARAATLYETVLDLASDLRGARRIRTEAEALLSRAYALFDCGRLEEARSDLERALERARSDASAIPPLIAVRILRHLGDVLAALARFDEGIALLEEAHLRATGGRKTKGARGRPGGSSPDPALLEEGARAAIRLVFVHFQQGRFREALAWGRRARPLVEALGRADLLGFLHNNLGLVHWSAGRFEEAARAFRRDLSIAEHRATATGSGARARGGMRAPSEIASACNNLGLICWNLGQIDEAEACYQRAIALHREGGRLLGEARSQQNLALLMEERGEHQAAARLNHQVLDTVQRLGDRRTAMQIWANLGANYLELRRHDESRAYFRRSLADAEALGIASALPDIHAGLARLEVETGRADVGRDHAATAVRMSREQSLPFDHGRSLRALALAEAALGETTAALRHLRESAAELQRIGAALEAAKTAFEEGLVLARIGRLPAARRRVAAALRAFDERGLRARAEAAREAARIVCPELAQALPARSRAGARTVAQASRAETPTAAEAAHGEAATSVEAARGAAAKTREAARAEPATLTDAARAEPRPTIEPPPSIYRIECFGPLRVFRPGESEPISPKQWGSHKARQILAYLLVTDPAGRGVLRERILSAVWPEAPPDTLGHTFHVTVSHLRKALAGGAPEALSPLVQEGGLYRLAWPGGVCVDAREFAEAMRRAGELEAAGQAYPAEAELKRALGVACGEFLEDVHFEWAEALRVRYRQDRFQALRKLAQAAQARWDFARARELAQRLLDEEPADESAHRIVIQSLLEEDRRAEALAQYRLCARLLQRQFGLAPAPETAALIGRRVR